MGNFSQIALKFEKTSLIYLEMKAVFRCLKLKNFPGNLSTKKNPSSEGLIVFILFYKISSLFYCF